MAVRVAEINRATTEGIPCVTSTVAIMGITTNYYETRNPLSNTWAHLVTRLALAVLRDNLVTAKTTKATISDGMAATTKQWTRANSGALAMEDVRTAALESGEIPLLKQVLETTVFVT